MRRIVLHAVSFKSFWAHYSLFTDVFLYEKFRELGYVLVLSNQVVITDEDYILFFEAKSLNYPKYIFPHLGFTAKLKYLIKRLLAKSEADQSIYADLYKKCEENNTLNRTLLIVLEGKIDAPENHSSKLADLCKYVFTWNDTLVDNRKIIKINWPQPVNWPKIKSVSFADKKLLTNISANKYSSHNLELYSLRREAISYFEDRFGNQFDLYGIGWNEPVNFRQKNLRERVIKFNSFKGLVESKAEIFAKYRFALIYENAQVTGWITEKIFDCLRSECIPIYLGAPNIKDFVPSNLFIDRRDFSDNEELGDFLMNMDESTYNQYLERISCYLKSEAFRKHLSPALAETIVKTIERES